MPIFDYRARRADGQIVQGAIEAANADAAQEILKDKGLSIDALDERPEAGLFSFELPFLNRIPTKDLVVFFRQFSVLIGAKVPVVSALRTVMRQTRHERLRRVIGDLANEVESGTALSFAMGRHSKIFGPFYVNMIRSGETTGGLEEVMNYLADQAERDYDLMSKIKGAMIYPAIIMVGLVAVGFIMMVFVVPKLTEVLKESGAVLPWTTRVLIATSGFFERFAVQIVIFGIVFGIAASFWVRQPAGRQTWDTAKLSLPIFGRLLQRIYIIRFTRSLGTLLKGGVDITSSLEICADVVGNANYRRQILETKREVADGNSITTVFATQKKIPKMVTQMLAVGEETGRLQEVLGKLTDFYSRELQNLVVNLVSAIEPIIMLVIGAAVAVMVAAVIMPMYNLAGQF